MLKSTESNAVLPRVGIIILAAGASTRMGQPKQLMASKGEGFLRRAVQTALFSVGKPVLVVLGANQQLIQAEVADLPIHIVQNPDWAEGMSSSIRAGIQQLKILSPACKAAILMLCDQPLVSPELINSLISSYQSTGLPLIACEYENQLGVPALFDRKLFSNLQVLIGQSSAKKSDCKPFGFTPSYPFSRRCLGCGYA